MVNFSLIREIDAYMSSYSFDNSEKFKMLRVKRFICDLINGNDVRLEKRELFENRFAEHLKSNNSMSDAEMLVAVLQSCDEETLLDLEKEFGEKSRITKIIREQIRKVPSKSSAADDSITTIENMLQESEKQENTLYSLICKYMAEKGFESDAQFYNSISMSRQNFARIRNNSNVGKRVVLWIIVGLKMDYHQAKEVLETAGYTFKNNDKRDVLISYIIKNVENYNIDTVNELLYHFGLPPFCDK